MMPHREEKQQEEQIPQAAETAEESESTQLSEEELDKVAGGVANSDSNTVSVIDGTTNTVIA